jgi:hypothetical protein
MMLSMLCFCGLSGTKPLSGTDHNFQQDCIIITFYLGTVYHPPLKRQPSAVPLPQYDVLDVLLGNARWMGRWQGVPWHSSTCAGICAVAALTVDLLHTRACVCVCVCVRARTHARALAACSYFPRGMPAWQLHDWALLDGPLYACHARLLCETVLPESLQEGHGSVWPRAPLGGYTGR